MRTQITAVTLWAASLMLAGCESTRSAPLEEARAVMAEYAELSYDPPPRSVEDITTLLDGPAPEGLTRAAELWKKLEALPPQNGDARKLGDFYSQRAWLALEIGLLEKALQDFQSAVEHYRESGISDRDSRRSYASAQEGLGRAYAQAGHLTLAIEAMTEAHGATPRNGKRIAFLAKFFITAGEMDTVRDYREKLVDLIASSPSPKQRDTIALLNLDVKLFKWAGNYQAAETSIREEIRRKEGRNPTSYYRAYAKLAKILQQQGRKVEAEIAAREAINGMVRSVGRNSGQVPRAVVTLAKILRSQGRLKDTEILMHRALEIFGDIGVPDGAVTVGQARVQLAIAIMAQGGRWAEAASHLNKVRETMGADNGMYRTKFSRNSVIPLAMLMTGRIEEAKQESERIRRELAARFGQDHYKTALAQAVLAMAQNAAGEKDKALENFQASVPVLFQRRRQRSGGGKGGGGWRIKLIVESYLSLLSDLARGDPAFAAVAFEAANWARAQSVQQALSLSTVRMTMGNPELAELARLEQDALQQIKIVNEQLVGMLEASDNERRSGAEAGLRRRLVELESAHAVLLREIERYFPKYAELINPDAASVEEARSVLRLGETLLSVYSGADSTYVWVVPRQGPLRFNRVPITRKDIARSVKALRRAVEPNARRLSDIPDFQVAIAHGLYRDLFAPVLDDLLADTKLLVFVSHGPLKQLPLSTLVTGPAELGPSRKPLFSRYRDIPWLIRKTAIASIPSVSSLIALRRAPPGDSGRRQFAGFGDPYFSRTQAESPKVNEPEKQEIASRGAVILRSAPAMRGLATTTLASLPSLPDTSKEIRAIAVALKADPERDVFLGRRASEESVYETELSKYRVIAFATHGLVPGDLDGLLQPALALSAPSVSDGSNDGLLTMEEITRLKLDADWVVLSACNTASGDGAGAEAVSGLGRSFFYAGSRALLVSNWPVETTSARVLTTGIFRRQAADASLGRAETLRQSMTDMIDNKTFETGDSQILFSYAHPIFWAPFTLVGDGGGAQPSS